jgi:hypothetical protein
MSLNCINYRWDHAQNITETHNEDDFTQWGWFIQQCSVPFP